MTTELDDELLIQRANVVYAAARSLYETRPHWLDFFREVFGVRGLINEAFATSEEREAFAETMHHGDIQAMLRELRESESDGGSDDKEPTRVITLRVPSSVHHAIRQKAADRMMSMNKYLLSRIVDEQE